MEQELQKSVKEEDKIQRWEVLGIDNYGEKYGNNWYFELQTMKDSYRITETERDAVVAAIENGAKFIDLGDNYLAVHQITGIVKVKSRFGSA